MSVEYRELTFDDAVTVQRLSGEAFGMPDEPPPAPDPDKWPRPGMRLWGAFDGGQLAAVLYVRDYHSWYHGREVRTAGIAGVSVVAEARGRGLLSGLFDIALAAARADGHVISTLFPTAPGIYRRLGYELITGYDTVEIPTSSLASVRAPEGVSVRRATAADFDTVRELYDAWAAAQNGPLTRRGPSFPATAEDFIGAFTGVTLAEAGGRVVGYASWTRGQGYDSTATIKVGDLIAVTPDAARALWRMLGSFASVSGQIHVYTSGADIARLVLPGAPWHVVHTHDYMLSILDVPGALTAIGYPAVSARLPFSVTGAGIDGSWTLEVTDGDPKVTDGGDGGPTFTAHGLALLYAGAQSTGNLRLAGQLTGPTDHDPLWDALLGTGQPHIRDYF
ncbi:GNAT family N-acetyltransferase [Nocardioides speluncae]|uniref:GNAT family N-acetyltransferase n=1 Tax=Nocardioides speluncae TaxID=2670337 RepID=UPI001379E75F|nr:GNAT family N-acetyltransferase [Nocardioides speluncae]